MNQDANDFLTDLLELESEVERDDAHSRGKGKGKGKRKRKRKGKRKGKKKKDASNDNSSMAAADTLQAADLPESDDLFVMFRHTLAHPLGRGIQADVGYSTFFRYCKRIHMSSLH